MVVTMTIVDIGTDPGPPSVSEMRASLSLPGLIGYVISHAGQTTQTGVLTGVLQPGQGCSVYVEFEDVVAYTGHPDAFARVELTLDLEPLRCTETNTASNVAGDIIGWNNLAGGSYSVASNWDPQRVPTHDCSEGDTAVFELDFGPEIFIDAANATAGAWRVFNNLYRFRGPAQLYSESTTDVSLEVSRGGWLNLAEGTLTTVHSNIGPVGGATAGRVTVQNPGTKWENYGQLEMSNGRLTLSAGGEVYSEQLSIGATQGQSATAEVTGVQDGTRSSIDVGQTLSVGYLGEGTLNIREGAIVWARDADVGLHSDGSVVLGGSSNPDDPNDSGSYAQIQAEGTLRVGGVGVGLLRLEQGGAAVARSVEVFPFLGGRGRIIVDGQGGFAVLNALTRLAVGGTNEVEVEAINGGRIVSESISIGGGVESSVADVTVRGHATLWEEQYPSSISTLNFPSTPGGVGAAVVGKDGPGQLNVLAGASANFRGGLVVGEVARGIVAVSNANAAEGLQSILTVQGATTIGIAAPGFVSVTGGGRMIQQGDLVIGGGVTNPVSTLTVEGDGSSSVNTLIVDGELSVGLLGAGELTVGPLATAICSNVEIGGITPFSPGTVRIGSLSTMFISGNAQVGVGTGAGELLLSDSSSDLNVDGTMTVGGPGGGRVVVNGTLGGTGVLVVASNGQVLGTGTIDTSLTRVLAGGSIAPGLSPGTLTVRGALELLPGGRLEMEYGGTKQGQFDELHVDGLVTLGGTLEVHFVDGFSPEDPETFVQSQDFIEAAGGVTGDFEQRVFVYPDRFADFDDDGDKDLFDVAAFQNCFGLSGAELVPACERADWENDGFLRGVELRELVARLSGPQ
jgi:T5SS/PEP-CTERM-associated repeat protein